MALNKFAVLGLLTVAYGPSLVHSFALWACTGNAEPNWTQCDEMMALIDWNVGSLPEDPPGVAAGRCQAWRDENHATNCIISACNARSDGASQPLNVFSGPNYYRDINANCRPINAGGLAPDLQGESGTYIQVFNDPDYRPASRIMRSAAAQGKLVSQVLTLAEVEALAERASQAQQPGTLHPRDDPTWKQVGLALSIRTDERDQLSGPTGSGASQSWSTSEGYSQGISSSVELGASFFDIFSASVSLSISYEYSQTYSKTLTFDPSGRCDTDQTAILYMYPLFDKYSGIYSDNAGTTVEWLIPVAPPNNFEIRVECLGGGN